jgi:hypothetical protein
MHPLEYIPHTPRKRMSKARAARIFLARNGICINCGLQIRPGQSWFIEHPESLAQGGSDDDADLHPSHTKCKAGKDAADAASKAKRDRLVTAGWDDKPASRLQGRGFAKRPKQHTATSPIRRKSAAVTPQGEKERTNG